MARQRYDVFVAYAHEETHHAEQLVRLLEMRGFAVAWDDHLQSGEDWRLSLREKMRQSRKIAVIWSAAANVSEEVKYELYQAHGAGKLVAFAVDDTPPAGPVRRSHHARITDWDAQADKIVSAIKLKPQALPPASGGQTATTSQGALPLFNGPLIGRAQVLKKLDQAWRSCDAPRSARKTNVVCLHAVGGAGKTAIVRKFFDSLANQGFRGASRICVWSADSQAAMENAEADVDSFMGFALEEFAYDGPPHGDVMGRARDLIRLVQKERSLIILDGIETLQYAPNDHSGHIKVAPLHQLVKELSAYNPGLLVLTSRQPVTEAPDQAPRVLSIALERLPRRDGADLLQHLGVRGRRSEIESAVDEVAGHALTLTLLGRFLDAAEGGNIKHRDRFDLNAAVPAEARDPETATLMARVENLVGFYERRLGTMTRSAGQGQPETAILRILGLFDGPAEGAALRSILTEPIIPGLTDFLAGLSPRQRSHRIAFALRRLRNYNILYPETPDDPLAIDAHPIIRALSAKQLREGAPDAWRAAHSRLKSYCLALGENHTPANRRDLEPFYRAVVHACETGAFREALAIFHDHIDRQNHFSTNIIGAHGSDLKALAPFYETPWDPSTIKLSGRERAQLLNMTGYRLRSVGRLEESAAQFEASANDFAQLNRWGNASQSYALWSETSLTLGDIDRAVELAERAAEAAERNLAEGRGTEAEAHEKWVSALCHLGEALHQRGRSEEARTRFAQVQQQQRNIYSIHGFRFASLLLDLGELDAAMDCAERSLRRERSLGGYRLPTALHLLICAECRAARGESDAALADANECIGLLRKTSAESYMALALIERARIHLALHDAGAALRDLSEAKEYAELAGMALRKVDAELVEAEVWLRTGQGEIAPASSPSPKRLLRSPPRRQAALKAHALLQSARLTIDSCRYERRRPKLQTLAKELSSLT